MKRSFTRSFIIFIIIFISLSLTTLSKNKLSSKEQATILRKSLGAWDIQKNTISNVDFYSSNFGIIGCNLLQNNGGTFWPRGSLDQYIFAGGFWFGAKKYLPGDSVPHKLVEISYNPNSGSSWFVPGRIEDGDLADTLDYYTYRTYFSTDFHKFSGIPKDLTDGPNWTHWIKPADLLETGLYL